MERRLCGACKQPRAGSSHRYYCRECIRDYKRAWRRRPNRWCYGCKRPIDTQNTRCKACDQAYRDRRFNRWSQPCSGGCGGWVGHGYRSSRCPDCRSMDYRESTLKGRR